VILENGMSYPKSIEGMLADLDTLENQTYPIELDDNLEGTSDRRTTTVHMIDREQVGQDDGDEIHRIVLQEADTS